MNSNEIPNHVTFVAKGAIFLCNHGNSDLFTCENTLLFSWKLVVYVISPYLKKKCFAIHSVTLKPCLNLPFSENLSNKIVNFMLDIMCPIIHEGESVPQELLDTVLVNIIEPQKVTPLIISLLWFMVFVAIQVKFQSQDEF